MKKETKNLRFKRVASKRVNKIIENFRLLGHCSNQNNYAYTQKQVDKIFTAILNSVTDTQKKFQPKESIL